MLIEMYNISKVYNTPNGQVKALDNVNFQVEKGEFVIIRGPSGSGKTTLLLSIGGMLRPTEGKVIINGEDIYNLSIHERANFRAENIGFIFQMFHLVPYLNVIENVMLSSGVGKGKTKFSEAEALLERLNLTHRKYHKPSRLSAGEKQRTAIGRAMLNHPLIILADEPTGNLDQENALEVMKYLGEFNKEGITVIIVTHGTVADHYADRIVLMREGQIF